MGQTVAVLGTGIMGAPMARNLLQAGFGVSVWNRTPDRARVLAEDGAEVADTAADAVGRADFVLTMLTDGEAVIEVMKHAAPAMPESATWLQASTVGEDLERLVRLAEEHDCAFLDCPVLGTKAPAEQGELVVLASGPDDQLDRAQPVFDAIGSRTVRLGETGAATRMKLVLNSWIVALVESLAETIAYADGIGVDPAKFLQIIDGGPMNAAYAQLKGKMMVEREFPASFPLKHSLKDARLVLDSAALAGIRLPVIEVVAAQMERAVKQGHGDDDLAAAILASLV